MANTLKFFRNGAVGFIDWLGARWREYRAVSSEALKITGNLMVLVDPIPGLKYFELP
jgi:hypothetical protein